MHLACANEIGVSALAGRGLGRYVFGAGAAALGAVALVPHTSLFVHAASAAQILGGIAILWRRSERLGAILLAVVYGIFSLQQIPAIVAHPAVYNNWNSFFEWFSLFSGALVLCGARRAGCFGFGLSLISFGLEQAFYLQPTASLVPAWIPPGPMFWAMLTTVAFVLAGVALLVRYQALLAARLTTLMLFIFGIFVWVPALVHQPGNQFAWSETVETFAICGVAWILSDVLASR